MCTKDLWSESWIMFGEYKWFQYANVLKTTYENKPISDTSSYIILAVSKNINNGQMTRMVESPVKTVFLSQLWVLTLCLMWLFHSLDYSMVFIALRFAITLLWKINNGHLTIRYEKKIQSLITYILKHTVFNIRLSDKNYNFRLI